MNKTEIYNTLAKIIVDVAKNNLKSAWFHLNQVADMLKALEKDK